MLNVLRMHRAEVSKIDASLVSEELLSAAASAWDEAVELGELYGVRNSQASVLAPTGTIGLMMDCDTTGIEPDLGLVKVKKLVGGGTMSIVNQTVPRALKSSRLHQGASRRHRCLHRCRKDYHRCTSTLKKSTKHVFACSMGDNSIHYLGHVKMMAAVQPFLIWCNQQDRQHARRGNCRRHRADSHRFLEDGPQGCRYLPRQL